MENLEINCRAFWYAEPVKFTENVDADGNYTGERAPTMGVVKRAEACISPASGQYTIEMFGGLEGYSHVLTSSDPELPLVETSVLWLDSAPIVLADGTLSADSPPYDHIVRRVSRWNNSTVCAVAKVEGEVLS